MKVVRSENQGFLILLLTVTVLMLSFSGVLVFFNNAFQEYKSVDQRGKHLKAQYLAHSGIITVLDLFHDLERYGYLELPIPIPFGNGYILYEAIDLSGKININYLVNNWDDSLNARQLDRLHRLSEHLGIPTNIWDGVIDWIDNNNLPMPSGYEKEHYASLDTPMRVKNSKLHSIEELLLIPGFDYSLLYTDIRTEDIRDRFNSDDSLYDEELELITEDDFILANNISAELVPTIHGAGSESLDRINVNTAPFLVLWSVLEQIENEEIIKHILRRRAEKKALGGMLSILDLKSIPGISQEILDNIDQYGLKFDGDVYKIVVTATVGSQLAKSSVIYNKLNRQILSYAE